MILQEVPLDFQLDMSHIQDLKKKKKRVCIIHKHKNIFNE